MSSGRGRIVYLWCEMLALFFGVPAFFALLVDPQRRAEPVFRALGLEFLNAIERPTRLLMPALMLFTVICVTWLLLDKTFTKRQLWNFKPAMREMPRILGLFAVGAAVMVGVAVGLDRYTDVLTIRQDGVETTALFRLPREVPIIAVLIFFFYPWFSAYPQEITHRAFFFHRYRRIFPTRASMICANSIAFMWVHVPFWHWMALALTLPGGVLFAWTYERSKSTLAATIEHWLYGWWAFVVGLGWFVFTGSIEG